MAWGLGDDYYAMRQERDRLKNELALLRKTYEDFYPIRQERDNLVALYTGAKQKMALLVGALDGILEQYEHCEWPIREKGKPPRPCEYCAFCRAQAALQGISREWKRDFFRNAVHFTGDQS